MIDVVLDVKDKFCRITDERALLSLCFKDINHFYELLQKANAADFLRSEHVVLFSIFCALENSKVNKFDVPMIINMAQREGYLDSIGNVEYILSIADMAVSSSNFGVYLQNVLEASTKYRLYNVMYSNLKELEESTKTDTRPVSDLIGKVEVDILDLSVQSRAVKEPINMSEGLRELIEERKSNRIEYMGLRTGFPILDRQIDGLVPGTLLVVAARPKMGKSTVLSNIATYAAYIEGIPVLYVDTEMTFGQWRDRNIANMTGLDERIIKHGGYDNETYNKIIDKCLRIVEKGKLFHEFCPGYNVDRLVALYKKYKIKHNIGLMVFDYLKEPDSSSLDRQRKEYQILGDVTTKLKDLCGELNIPALTAVQLNRDEDIADSDRIARYADVICLWKSRDPKDIQENGHLHGTHTLHVRETRRGGSTKPSGICYKFFKKSLHIEEVPAPNQLDAYGDKIINAGSAEDDDLLT